MEREREGEREKAAIGISAGFITQPGGNEPRNPGRGGIASLVPASPCASLRRKLPGRPFPRVYHVVKGTSCRSSREGEREREREPAVVGSYRDSIGDEEGGRPSCRGETARFRRGGM